VIRDINKTICILAEPNKKHIICGQNMADQTRSTDQSKQTILTKIDVSSNIILSTFLLERIYSNSNNIYFPIRNKISSICS